MDNDKSIIEKFTETMKGLADSASEALKSEEPPKADQTNAAYMPLAAEGMVSDPLLVPPVAQPVRKKRRGAKKAPKRARTATPKTSAPRKAAKKSAAARSKKSMKKAAKTSAKQASARKAAGVSAKKRSKTAAAKRRRR